MRRVEEERNILHTVQRRKANWIGHIFHRDCLPKQVSEGKIEGRLDVIGRQGRRRKQPLGDIKETSGFFFNGATTLIVLAFSTIAFHLGRSCTCSHMLHLLQIISDVIFPSRLGPSCWSSCEWFQFVYSFYYASFGHSIYVSKPTQSLGFNIIYYVTVFN